MNLQAEESTLRRSRRLGLIATIGIASVIALANLSSEPLTTNFLEETILKGRPAERTCGWPFAWYWRSKGTLAPQWSLSRYSGSRLAANAAMWLAMLVAVLGALQWLLRRFRPRLHWRSRVSTICALMVVSALIVLANLSFDVSPEGALDEFNYGWNEFHYGWPLIWYWHLDWVSHLGAYYREWDHSAAALAGNVTIWLAMLAATRFTWQSLLDRYRPRLRWSLRSMLAVVAMVAALCAWCDAMRNRADDQEAVLESFRGESGVYFERRGPKWLDVVGAERFCRHIVLVRLAIKYTERRSEEDLTSFKRLARLPDLRCLCIEPDTHPRWPRGFIHETAATLSTMAQLRMLDLECQPRFPCSHSTFDAAHQYLAAIGKLIRLERLRVSIWTENAGDLAFLSNLTNLKTLALNIEPINHDVGARGSDNGRRLLARLPALPRLEELDLHEAWIGDEDLARLTAFARLKRLDLSGTSVTDTGLSRLALLESLEELAIDERIATPADFEAMVGLKRLKAIHIALPEYGNERSASVGLDDGQKLALSTGQLGAIRSALRGLRQSHPGIVIDGNYQEFAMRVDLQAPWDYDDHGLMDAFRQRWLRED